MWGLERTAELLIGTAPRIHWYSLYDLPRAWPATTRHREAEGSSYYRHFYMGLLREDGTPKPALERFADYTPGARHLPVVPLRGPPAGRRGALAEAARRAATCAPACPGPTASGPNALAWFDRQMEALADFDVTVTFCFTPEHRGIAARITPARRSIRTNSREFCAAMLDRYGRRIGLGEAAA